MAYYQFVTVHGCIGAAADDADGDDVFLFNGACKRARLRGAVHYSYSKEGTKGMKEDDYKLNDSIKYDDCSYCSNGDTSWCSLC